jgi:hypothetical protein
LSALLKLLSFQCEWADLGLPPLLLLLLPGINDCHPADKGQQDTKGTHFHGVRVLHEQAVDARKVPEAAAVWR